MMDRSNFKDVTEFKTGNMHKVVVSLLVTPGNSKHGVSITKFQTEKLSGNWDGNKGGITISEDFIDNLIGALQMAKTKSKAFSEPMTVAQ